MSEMQIWQSLCQHNDIVLLGASPARLFIHRTNYFCEVKFFARYEMLEEEIDKIVRHLMDR